MTITLKQLATNAKIDQEKLLKRIQQSFPDYQGQDIDGRTAFAWIPRLRKDVAGNALNLRETIRLSNALFHFAEMYKDGPASSALNPAGGTASAGTGKNSTQEVNTMNREYSETQARAQWDRDPKLRAEFGDDLESFLAYEKATAAGLVSVHGSSNVTRGDNHA